MQSFSRPSRVDHMNKPKRPLSAYNLFFQTERIKLLESHSACEQKDGKKGHGKIGFGGLARKIADKWKVTDEIIKAHYKELAAKEKRQYALDMVEWAQRQEYVSPAAEGDTSKVERTEAKPQNRESSLSGSSDRFDHTTSLDEPSCRGVHFINASPDPVGETAYSLPEQSYSCCFSPSRRQQTCVDVYHAQRPTNIGPTTQYSQTPVASLQSSLEMLRTVMEQPGMADFMSQLHQVLSGKHFAMESLGPPTEEQPILNTSAVQELPQTSCTSQMQPRLSEHTPEQGQECPDIIPGELLDCVDLIEGDQDSMFDEFDGYNWSVDDL